MKKGILIVLEGPDRSGKTTQAGLLKSWLEGLSYKVRLTREPGGTAISERIREILLSSENKIKPMTELFLFETSRMQHTLEIIEPALEAGEIVISDRYCLSTVAYQGFGRGLPLGTVEKLNEIATDSLEPALTVVFQISDETFAKRIRAEEKENGPDRIEKEDAAFRERVALGYKYAAGLPGVVRINADRKAEDIHEELKKLIKKVLP